MRRGERGAETLELIGVLPLLAIVVLSAWQAIVLGRERGEAEADARTLARYAVLCPQARPPQLSTVDGSPSAASARVDVERDTATRGPLARVSVTVSIPPVAVVPGLDLGRLGVPWQSATVTMRQEPCG